MTRPIAIYGAGGLGREVAQAVRASSDFSLIGFLDDGKAVGTMIQHVPVLGGFEALRNLPEDAALYLAMGVIETHRSLLERIGGLSREFEFPNLIHPAAVWEAASLTIGIGNYIGPGAVITADVKIGNWNIINANTLLAHDVEIGDRCQINPAAAVNGQVHLGNEVVVGTGAVILPRVVVEDAATIGAGAVVSRKRVRAGVTMLGNPASVFRGGNR